MDKGTVTAWPALFAHLAERWGARATRAERAVAIIAGQTVEIGAVDVFGSAWVELVGPIGSARHASPFYILERNFQVPIGAIGLDGGELMVRQRLPLDGLRLVDFDVTLASIASTAQHCAKGINQLRLGLGKIVTP